MPEIGSVVETHSVSLENSSEGEIVGELFLSSDVIKSGDFNPEDHVILVVPESSEHLGGENGASYVIPTSEDTGVCDALTVDPDRLRETIKSNFLVITKLLPSKSPPPLVPIVSSKLGGEVLKVVPEAPPGGPVLHKLLTPRPTAPKTTAKTRQPRTPRSPGVKLHNIKQEVPEIFGKMFPASYNEVMYKQIREIIYFKCGKGTTEETEVLDGISCPHCRKNPLTLFLLKEHLTNCHTYSSAKRKNPSPVSSTVTIKKTLFKCQYCDEAFISHAHRDSHECSLSVKPLEHVQDAIRTITCGICFQDFGSPSELKCHQDMDHKAEINERSEKIVTPATKITPPPEVVKLPRKTYVVCQYCDKRVSSSLKEEHLQKHRVHEAEMEAVRMKSSKCLKCLKPGDLNSSTICTSCSADVSNQNPSSPGETVATAICPDCGLEVDTVSFHVHLASHHSDTVVQDEFVVEEHYLVRIRTCSTCQDEFKLSSISDSGDVDKCMKCRIS